MTWSNGPGRNSLAWLRPALLVIGLGAGMIAAWRVSAQPFLTPVKALSIFAACCVAAVLLDGIRERPCQATAQWRVWLGATAIVAAAVVAVFWPALALPLNSDDFFHIQMLRRGAALPLSRFFTGESGGPGSWRPLVMLSYAADLHLFGLATWPRHATDLALHACNSVLVLLLGRKMGLRPVAATGAGLLFGASGVAVEAACWYGARFDVVAAAFTLSSLLAALEWVRSGRRRWLGVALLAGVGGMISKESAFALPLMALALLWSWRRAVPFAVLGGAVFAARWAAVGGVGGYMDPHTGKATVLSLSPLRSAHAIFARAWGVLAAPVNWSRGSTLAGAFLLALAAGALLWLAWRHRGNRMAWSAAGMSLAAMLPVQHMLLIDASLERSRYLYLAAAGFALFIGVLVDQVPRVRWQAAALSALLVFHVWAVRNNLALWAAVTRQGFADCSELGRMLREDPSPAYVIGVPAMLDGVYYVRNGLAGCLEVYQGIAPDTVAFDDGPLSPAGRRLIRWNPATGAIERVQSGESPSRPPTSR